MSFEEMSPELYEELGIECARVRPFGAGAVIAFRVWDNEDAWSDQSFLFRTHDFKTAERVWAIEGEIRDLWVQGDTVFVLTPEEVVRFDNGQFEDSTTMAHGLDSAKSLVGSGEELFVVGDGIRHFDGEQWRSLECDLGNVPLVDIAIDDAKAFAVGDQGLLVEIADGRARRVEVPEIARDSRFTAVYAANGTVQIAGDVCLSGTLQDLSPVSVPEDVEGCLGVGGFDGTTFWGFVGDNQGLGLFAQHGDEFENLTIEIAARMAASSEHLWVAGEALVFRFDGTELLAMGIGFSESLEQWSLVAMASSDDEDDEEDDEDDD